jgi:hypothetical protein
MKKYLEYWPLITVVAFVVSYYNLDQKYSDPYGLDVVQYFEPSEILFNSMSFVLMSGLFLMGYMPIVILFNLEESPLKTEIASEPTKYSMFHLIQRHPIVTTLAMSLMLCGVYYRTYLLRAEPPLNEHVAYLIGLGMSGFIAIFIFHIGVKEKTISRTALLIAGLISTTLIMVLVVVQLQNYAVAKNRLYGHSNERVKLTLNDNTIFETNDSTIYVGGSGNYYFFIKIQNKQLSRLKNSIVIPKKDVKLTEFTTNSRGIYY